jgi:DNA-binding transcriptional LysR family regulator
MSRTGISELNDVVAVATHRSYRPAAAELGVSPSALSHTVAALEQRVGVRLFNRTTRSVSVSPAGEQFLRRVRPALGEISSAMRELDELKARPSGTLRLNASHAGAQLYLMPAVMEFLRRHPDMQVEIATEDRLVDIVAEGFDAGLRLAESVPGDMVAVRCGPDLRFAVVGTPGYFRKRSRPRTPGELAGHDCIRRRWPSGAIFRWEFEKRGEELVVDVKGSLTLDQDDLILAALRAGAGLAYVNEVTVAKDLESKRLVRVLENWTPTYPGPRLYYPGHRHVPAGLRAFVDVVRELAAK